MYDTKGILKRCIDFRNAGHEFKRNNFSDI